MSDPTHGLDRLASLPQARDRIEHIAVFLADLTGGGAERAMLNLCSGFAARGIKVDLVLAAARGPYLGEVPDTVRLVNLGGLRVSRAIVPLARYLREHQPDVLFTTLHHVSLAATIAHLISRSHVVLFLREASTPSRRPVPAGAFRSRFIDLAMRWAYAAADGVVAVSEGAAADLRRAYLVPNHKLWTLYSPIVTADVAARAALPAGHPWLDAADRPVLLGVGRLRSHKGFLTLLDAFCAVRAQRQVRLVVLGEGAQRTELEARARALGVAEDVAFPGFVDNPFAFMAKASVFVLASEFEGLPGTLIQAMACGCSVVATDCPSGPAEVLDGGRYGHLVPIGDVNAMAAAILVALDAPTDTAALQSRASRFAREPVVADHLAAFEAARMRRGPQRVPRADSGGRRRPG